MCPLGRITESTEHAQFLSTYPVPPHHSDRDDEEGLEQDRHQTRLFWILNYEFYHQYFGYIVTQRTHWHPLWGLNFDCFGISDISLAHTYCTSSLGCNWIAVLHQMPNQAGLEKPLMGYSSQYLQLLWLAVQVASGQVFIHRASNIPQLDRSKEDLQEEVLVLFFLWSIWSLCGHSEADLSHHWDTSSRKAMRGLATSAPLLRDSWPMRNARLLKDPRV